MSNQIPVPANVPAPKKKRKGGVIILVIIAVFAIAWILIRPGVFTVQPIGAVPDGVTIIYHSRSSEMPFFSSPDGLCLEYQGSVSLLCRMAMLSEAVVLLDREIFRLPYSNWAYLQSTGGLEFEK